MLTVRILKVSLTAAGVLIIAIIIIKAITIVKEHKKILSLKGLIDRGIHPTIRGKVKTGKGYTENGNNSL